MSQSTLNNTEVNEGATPTYSAQLQDENGDNLAKASLTSCKLRIIDINTGAVIQTDTSILDDISTGGLITTILPALDMQDTSGGPLSTERHKYIFTTVHSSKTDVHHMILKVMRSTEG